MPKTTLLKQETKTQLPSPIETKALTVNGQKYEVLRYAEKEGPTFAQTIEIAKSMTGKEMLTMEEAMRVRDNDESKGPFRDTMQFGEWSYVRSPEAEIMSLAAIFDPYRGRGESTRDYRSPGDASPAVILKVGHEAVASKETQSTSNNVHVPSGLMRRSSSSLL